MRKWIYDRPWIWIVVLLASMVVGGFATLVIAELNQPEIVKEKRSAQMALGRTPGTPDLTLTQKQRPPGCVRGAFFRSGQWAQTLASLASRAGLETAVRALSGRGWKCR